MMVVHVAEEPKGSRSGNLTIQKAFLSPLARLRDAFGTSADYAASMKDDRNLVTEMETRAGCKFYLLYLLIRCEDPDEAHLLNEIVRIPIPQNIVDRSRHTYLEESWQERLKQHFQIPDDTPFADLDDQDDDFAGIRSGIPRDADFGEPSCDWLFLLIALVVFVVFLGRGSQDPRSRTRS
ncbi:hypothetical protein M407DRAFT_163441 [Tulasnella calospora MUT 4182]|uniref:Uncharacterized protein n=1 Tax=Tulasnella calospora MUT 4182 TaxID=1051891 RepID=A0A0C3QQC5_9AGAM|nr:hypothetical protein M407DRAFT_163441 [Tulasnella calospora MUT 4182]